MHLYPKEKKCGAGALARVLAMNKRVFICAVFICVVITFELGHTTADSPPTLRTAAEKRGVKIGAAVAPFHLNETQYASTLAAEFSQLEPENAMKFGPIHPRSNTDHKPFDFASCDRLVKFAQEHKMAVRGHTLVWHQQDPKWLLEGGYSSTQLSNILKDHITKVLSHFGNLMYAYDVVNEAFNDDGTMRSTIWYDKPGIGSAGHGTKYIGQALIWAHDANPEAKLFYNDYDAELAGTPKSDAIYAMAKDFKKRAVPLDGIGLQMHVDLAFDQPAKLQALSENIQRLGALGLEVHITELDVRLPSDDAASLKAQGHLYGEIIKACVQQPSCKAIQFWGVTDKYSWIPEYYKGMGWALPFDDQYQRKPAYRAILDALR
nr:endo-1,4-beta-xylanase Z [uncultured bacterium]